MGIDAMLNLNIPDCQPCTDVYDSTSTTGTAAELKIKIRKMLDNYPNSRPGLFLADGVSSNKK